MEIATTITEIEKEVRGKILDFEEQLKDIPGAFIGDSDLCPLKHSFADGIYVREIFIPKGVVLTGKIHKHSHPNFLMKGKVEVFTEFGGYEILEGPIAMISLAGTKRVVKSLEDTTWITVHVNQSNTTDLQKLEKFVIADSYEDYEKYKKGSYLSRAIGLIKKLLIK